jgi:hypothetical protein
MERTLTGTISWMEIACTLTSADLARQAARWQALTQVRRVETEDGLRVTFAGDVGAELDALVAVENDCCRWAQWRVENRDTLVVTSSGDGVAVSHGMLRA